MHFDDYLTEKNIDAARFKVMDVAGYTRLAALFVHMHPRSFTAQKLFLLNNMRKNYGLTPKPTPKK